MWPWYEMRHIHIVLLPIQWSYIINAEMLNTIWRLLRFVWDFSTYICVFIPDDDMDVDPPHLDPTAPVLIPPSSYDVSKLIPTLQRDSSRQRFIPPQALYEAIHWWVQLLTSLDRSAIPIHKDDKFLIYMQWKSNGLTTKQRLLLPLI